MSQLLALIDLDLAKQILNALDGDSNDAEHDALYDVAEALNLRERLALIKGEWRHKGCGGQIIAKQVMHEDTIPNQHGGVDLIDSTTCEERDHVCMGLGCGQEFYVPNGDENESWSKPELAEDFEDLAHLEWVPHE